MLLTHCYSAAVCSMPQKRAYWRRTCLFDDQLARIFSQPTTLCAVFCKLCVCMCLSGLSFNLFCLCTAGCWLHPLCSRASVLEYNTSSSLCISVMVVTKVCGSVRACVRACVCVCVCVRVGFGNAKTKSTGYSVFNYHVPRPPEISRHRINAKSFHPCSVWLRQWRVPHFALKYHFNPTLPPERQTLGDRPPVPPPGRPSRAEV